MSEPRKRMFVEMRVGERLKLYDGRVVVTVEQKSGQRSRLRIEADSSVKVEPPNKMAGSPA